MCIVMMLVIIRNFYKSSNRSRCRAAWLQAANDAYLRRHKVGDPGCKQPGYTSSEAQHGVESSLMLGFTTRSAQPTKAPCHSSGHRDLLRAPRVTYYEKTGVNIQAQSTPIHAYS